MTGKIYIYALSFSDRTKSMILTSKNGTIIALRPGPRMHFETFFTSNHPKNRKKRVEIFWPTEQKPRLTPGWHMARVNQANEVFCMILVGKYELKFFCRFNRSPIDFRTRSIVSRRKRDEMYKMGARLIGINLILIIWPLTISVVN